MLLIVVLFLRMETINRRTEINEMRISDVESRMKISPPNKVDDKDKMKTSMNFQSGVETVSVNHDHQRKKRNVAKSPTAETTTLQHIRQEINNKFNQACTTTDKLCQTGPPGPPGAHGYPGYKGEKGAPGKTGQRGPLGPVGAPGASGKRGPVGPQGIKGEKGEEGSVGAPGVKGEVGRMGHPGEKGSIGSKGNKGSKGSVGIQGLKGECVVPPKISVYPVSQEVFVNKKATFYCWVHGQTSSKITWRKLGGTLLNDVTVEDGMLQIKSVQRSHTGSYICTAYTGHGLLKTIGSLQVKESPKFTNKPPSEVIIIQGTTVSVCCEATGSPTPNVEWSRAQTSSGSLPVFQEDGCLLVNTAKENVEGDYICRAINSFGLAETITTVIANRLIGISCDQIQNGLSDKPDGAYYVNAKRSQSTFSVYCDMTSDNKGWTLIARFSNNDVKNWMADTGYWWYDQRATMGTTSSPFVNADMISPAFWFVSGKEFKITRSDDPSHTPLLQTTGNCLAGQTFRSKITSYGDFRNGKVWASDQCLGSCTVQYGGQYKSTDGFQQAECSGNIQSANKIGFWCDVGHGDGAVMMIGGGGSCSRADHGIGITEAGEASFIDDVHAKKASGNIEYDFGFNAMDYSSNSKAYALNLWIR